jgi:hypothetical protein
MKTKLFAFGIAVLLLFSISSCTKESLDPGDENTSQTTAKEVPDPKNEDSGIITPADQLIAFSHQCNTQKKQGRLKYGVITHEGLVYTCATMLGLTDYRATIMGDASVMPDVYQSGIDNAYNQQWSHAFIVIKTFWGAQWVWGDADDDFNDNMNVVDGEGYDGKCASYYYDLDDRDLGDWYVGYACHYISDVSFVLHTTVPNVNMIDHHFDFENWISNNWTSGHNFSSVASAVPASSYYTISNLKTAINNAAKASNYSYSTNAKLAWDNFVSSGFPTSAGSGNSNCVYYTQKMVEEATRWTGGAIKYAMDANNQW